MQLACSTLLTLLAAWHALRTYVRFTFVVCRYEFGTLDANNNRKVLAVDPPLPFVFTGLPVGNITLFVCAVDPYNARVCANQLVTVKAAAADFKVTDALTAINVAQLAGANDVSVMAAGAQALQSLAIFANDAAATQTADQQAQVQTAIAAKTSSMIGALAKDVNNLIDDPKTMSQVGLCLWCNCSSMDEYSPHSVSQACCPLYAAGCVHYCHSQQDDNIPQQGCKEQDGCCWQGRPCFSQAEPQAHHTRQCFPLVGRPGCW